jgi:ribosomal protein L12E/L44/L45/RPP1/RPP2
VYAGRGTDVRTVVVDGHVLVSDFELQGVDLAEVLAEARTQAAALARRAL